MEIVKLIDIVCRTLELDKDVLLCSNYRNRNCPQTQKYSDGRMIITYVLRNQKKPTKHKDIAHVFNRNLKDGTGDHAISIYYERTAKDLFKTDVSFRIKLNKILDATNKAIEQANTGVEIS